MILPFGAVHALEAVRIGLDQVVRGPVISQLDHIVIHQRRLLSAFEIGEQHLINEIKRNVEELGDRADISHVFHQLAEGGGISVCRINLATGIS